MTEALGGDPLIQAIHEFDSGELRPELVKSTWDIIWKEWGKKIGHEFQVPEFDGTRDDLELQRAKYRRVPLLIPDEVMTPEGLLFFSRLKTHGIMLPEEAILQIRNDSEKGGLVYVDLEPRTHLGWDHDRFRAQLTGREHGQRLATYMVASHFRKLASGSSGRYLDDDLTYSRIPGSTFGDNQSVTASFNPDGSMIVIPGIELSITRSHIGWRTEVRSS